MVTRSLFQNEQFQSQWLRTAGHSSSGGADVGECLAAARRIKDGDTDSWFNAWLHLGESLYAAGQRSRAEGHRISARHAFLRAANYHRAAYTFLMGISGDARLNESYQRHRLAFDAAAELMEPPARRINIPCLLTTLHGYLFRPSRTSSSAPTLIINGGYDSTAEELYFYSGAAAVERGYTVIVFDGPGQGSTLIEQQLPFRPDWEVVIKAVVDFAIGRPEVDPTRVALMGISFGGYLASRGAAGDRRIAALIADPGQFSLFDEIKTTLPEFLARELPDGSPLALVALRAMLHHRLQDPIAGWPLRRGMWTHGMATPLEYLRSTAQYTLQGRAEQIRCPAFICAADHDHGSTTARKLFDALACSKQFITFSCTSGAGEHCEAGARQQFHQRALDWLDDVLAKISTPTVVW